MRPKRFPPTLTILLLLSLCPSASPEGDVTTEDVRKAIEAGVQYLRRQQWDDGAWPYMADWTTGATALAVFALVHAGVSPNDPAVQKGVEYILRNPIERTYSVSLTIIALASVDPARYRGHIQRGAEWLLAAQAENGQWTYGKMEEMIRNRPRGQILMDIKGGDNSNTQFAVLGLREAARAGATVPQDRWRKISAFYRKAQNDDGGWGYLFKDGRSYGSMTAAGVCGLVISTSTQSGAHRCGYEKVDRDVERGIEWLAQNFTVTTNPDSGLHYYYYYMYALERVGVLAGERLIGGHDWYREGAAQLVRRQGRDGSWGQNVPDTCFGLLFLGKGGAPVAVSKLRWRGDWNNDPRDAENLTKFHSTETKINIGWEAIDISAPLTEWMRAPILYLNGHQSPDNFSDEEIQKVRDFVDQGGFLFAEACCDSPAFDKGFRSLAKRIFPESELVKLEPDHPIYSMRYRLEGNPPELWGVNTGCRLSVIYAPKDFSCAWETERWDSVAFKIGVNILSYGTGDEPLRGKLDRIIIGEKGEAPKPPPRGALVIAQIRHGSDWNTDPLAMTKLMLHLRENTSFDVGNRRKVVMLSDPDLFDYPILYMTSHSKIALAREEIERLRTYLERGGFLFSDACCGSKVYDASFRGLVKELFPGSPLEPLPESHPIYTLLGGIKRVQYKPRVLAEEPGKEKPELEGVALNGRTAIVYSKYDITCAIHGHPCPACRGVVAQDAFRLATAIVLYAMTF